MTPQIAVVTSCYGQAHFLAEAMRSVWAQTFPHYEHVIVLDASPDNAFDVARAECGANPRVRILAHQENRGNAAAQNTGARNTSAPWILKVDADDTIEPTYLEAILRAAEVHPAANVIFSPAHVVSPLREYVFWYPPFVPAEMADTFMIPGPAAYRRELWEAVGGFDESLRVVDDWDFYVRAEVAVGLRPVQLPVPLWNYRDHDGPRMSRQATDGDLAAHRERWRALLRRAA